MPIAEEIAQARAHEHWIWDSAAGVGVVADVRRRFAGGLLYQVIENAGAVRALLVVVDGEPRYGSAAALVRPIFEMFVRALWVNNCADDDEVAHVSEPANDDEAWNPRIRAMTQIVDDRNALGGRLLGLHDRYWNAFCSYAHGGLRIVGRRNADDFIGNVATEGEMIEIVRFATLMALLAASVWFDIAGSGELARQATARAAPYWAPQG